MRFLIWLFLLVFLSSSSFAEGIYADDSEGTEGTLVIHGNGAWEYYGDSRELPGNSISLGYILNRGEAGSEVPGSDNLKAEDTCDFFPSAAQLADSGLTWENDEIGTLTFRKDGTVFSDYGFEGHYDLGILQIASRFFYVQRTLYTEDFEGDGILSDLVLTLYEIQDGEVAGRLLLVENGECIRLEE